MMYLNKGFALTQKFYLLILVPIVLDLLQLGDILRRVQGFNIRFTVPSAIPSLTQVLAESRHGAGSGITVNIPYSYLGGAFLIIFVVSLIAGSFLKGGFLGCVLEAIYEKEISIETFIKYAKEFFTRFLLQSLLMFILMVVIFPFVLVLGPTAFILFIGIVILFLHLIFWDYIIVAENLKLIDAAQVSLKLVSQNFKKVFTFILPIILSTAIFSIVANAVVAASAVFAIISIVFYAYLGTVVVFAMMSFYLDSFNSKVNDVSALYNKEA